MATQTALAITEVGKPLTVISLPIPDPKKDDILIKMTVVGLTPLDQKLRDYGLFDTAKRLPFILGFDLVGIVVKSGSSSPAFPIGSHIFAQSPAPHFHNLAGGLRQYALVQSYAAALVPENITDADAAVFPVNAFTSASALFASTGEHAGFGFPFPGTLDSETFDYKSKTVVIIGGGTACGKFAVQLARIAGIGRVIVTASLSSEQELKSYGATHVLDRKAPDLEVQLRALVGDDLLYLYDTFNMGDHSFSVSLLSNSKKGTVVHLLPGEVSEAVKAQKKAGYEERQLQGSSELHPELAGLFWKVFPKWVENGEIQVLEYKTIEGLDSGKVNAALDGYRDGKFDRWHVRL
ncbi:hypothetical protein QTJ16_004136 [Diplocarpon rosae]|uniref:Alcohol dehydrogenase n=1 Tax=Diplocarpon rosae TaxID=946125 RepID=A0AAD9T062_9HELO|nr:hypothetical protein QTJ16_004136 [Diplocarpon rosae]PBP22560.1 hypothetical protein BUE80_DR006519 [Diplocarpon rosae]